MTKVLIVDDHASMRESLTTALQAAGAAYGQHPKGRRNRPPH